jgi:hypothetical protein
MVALLLTSPIVGAEPKYPAADFQPGVVYKDEKLIQQHSEAAKSQVIAPAAPQAAAAPKAAAPIETPAPSAAIETAENEEHVVGTTGDAKGGTVGNLPIALVVLAIGGFAFWSSRKGAPKPAETPAAPAISGSTGETGVEKYLKSMPEVQGAPETGVAKYLRSVIATEPPAAKETGVAKYLKNLPEPVSTAETGVAKYLKNIK